MLLLCACTVVPAGDGPPKGIAQPLMLVAGSSSMMCLTKSMLRTLDVADTQEPLQRPTFLFYCAPITTFLPPLTTVFHNAMSAHVLVRLCAIVKGCPRYPTGPATQ